MLPSWVSKPASPMPVRRRSSSAYVERTLRESARLVDDAVFAERVARRPGFLQALDARVKLISLLALLVAASFLHHLPSLWLLAACIAVAAASSRVGAGVLLNRVWWFLPATFVIIAVPAVFSVVTPGDPLVVIYRLSAPVRIAAIPLPTELSITRQGVASAALVVTRLFIGVLIAVTLTLTTRWHELLRAAYSSVTAPFVLILSMTYRYLFVLLRTAEGMHLGRRARTISPRPLAEQHRWTGGRIAFLFWRSRRLSEHVYEAMLARGYRGEPKALTGHRVGLPEAAWLLACTTAISLALFLDRAVLGHLPW